MGKPLTAPEIYASQLVHLGYGHPLWYPEPTKSGEVEIGDVGYIDDGHFHRLFNACRDADHPMNKEGVPEGFEPLRLPTELVHDRPEVVKAGESLCSDSVQKVKIEISAESPTSPVSAGGGYTFNTKGKRGAVAVLKDGGTQQSVSRSTAFQSYILAHHASWHVFARKRGVALRVRDLVLVAGFVKTGGWALAAYSNNEAAHEASLSVDATGIFSTAASFSLEEQNDIGLRHRVGPSDQDAHTPVSPPDSPLNDNIFLRPRDQCVFLQYYKCQPRGLGLVTLRKPQNLRPKDMMESVGDECFCVPFDGFVRSVKRLFGGCRHDVDVVRKQPQERSTEDPVAALLQYISKSSSADVAVTSHADLYDLLRGAEWPANVKDYLKQKRPKIAVNADGIAQLDVSAIPPPSPPPPPVPEKTLPPLPQPKPVPVPTHPRGDSMDDADPSIPGAWRKTLLAPLDVHAARMQATESRERRTASRTQRERHTKTRRRGP